MSLPSTNLDNVKQLALLASALALVAFSPNAMAQSSGTQAQEEELAEVTVTSKRQVLNFAGVTEQNAPKSRIAVTSDYLDTQTAGQTVFQSINLVPGVNFTNSDAYGSSGGNLRIRSFDGSRVSVTFDGLPLNDSGNYALFTNQMLDPELVDRVEINLGTTDVDSPTASATGGTVAFSSKNPTSESGLLGVLSFGTESYKRGLLQYNVGEFGPLNTKAWVSASYTKYNKFKGPGEQYKRQVNALLRQDFDSGSWLKVGFHFNRNRNNFYRTASDLNYQTFGREYDNNGSCLIDPPTAGVRDNNGATPVASTATLLAADNPLNPSACSNYFGLRVNPTDTANLRIQSLWKLSDKVTLTIDPSIQYVLANGGGTSLLDETPAATSADKRVLGVRAGSITGFDLNGDGDVLDAIRVYSPNTTNTYRFGVTSSLIWNMSESHRVRVAYTLDRARHRQTAQNGPVDFAGDPQDVFAGWTGATIPTADGSVIRGRDRYSIAELSQVAAEYRGKFFDDRFTATVGLRAPNFKRELNNYCYSQNGGNGNTGQLLCTTQTPVLTRTNGNVVFVNSPTAVEYIAPYSETLKFDDVLPNLGLTYKPLENHSFYVSYAEGLSAPRTDNLYAIRRLPDNTIGRRVPESESTKSYDLGWRFNTDTALASVAVWKSDYKNRIVSSFDPDLGFNTDRNVGVVKLWGVDAQIGWRPLEKLTFSFSASYNQSELQDNIQTGATTFVATAGKTLVETPEWTFGSRGEYKALDDKLRLAVQAKFVGDRFATDLNDQVSPSYTVLDFDASYKIDDSKLEGLRLKLNINNLLDEEYYGNISSGTGGTSVGFFSIGAPRSIVLSAEVKF